MNAVYISVIIPEIRDENRLEKFCSSLFSSSVNTELCICGKLCDETVGKLGENYGDKIKLFPENGVNSALKKSLGTFVMFSDEGITFASDAFETLLVKGRGGSAVCNAAYVSDGISLKLFREGFSADELSAEPFFANYLFRKSVISDNELTLTGSDRLSFLMFISNYIRYEKFNTVDEVLVYSERKYDFSDNQDFSLVSDFASIMKQTGDSEASLYFLRAVFTAACEKRDREAFDAIKSAAECFSEDLFILKWAEAQFGLDIGLLLSDSSDYSDFSFSGNKLHYREICLPMNKDDVIMNFYSGKFGIDVLKKCIGAWLYYKFYRGKNGVVKKLGCRFSMMLLGGDFDA